MQSLFNPLFKDRGQPGGRVAPFVIILLLVTALASASNLLLPESSALHVSTYSITLLGKYLSYAMLALAVDVIWGYC
ncbi:urea ABC transporter permease subunit UrtC, partial [Oceanospirillum sp. HFRX-1_2]